jgi:16S rRNA (uracil1498-N3)-methyltransferase
LENTPFPAFMIARAAIVQGYARLGGAELHHLRDVLRLRPGAGLALIDETGGHITAELVEFLADAAIVRIGDRAVAAAPPLVLAIGLIKEPRMDYVVEKAVELGASEIQPLICAHSLSRRPGAERIARWRRLAVAAIKQSLTDAAPVIKDPIGFEEFLGTLPRGMLAILCQANGPGIGTILPAAQREGIAVTIGPEGDFTPQEVSAAQRAGFAIARLNRNRLRSETAAIAALSLAAGALLELREVE